MASALDRRKFLKSAGFSAASLMGILWLDYAKAAEDKRAPDLIVINARVTTMDPSLPQAEAFAITGSYFSAVGRTSQVKSLAGPRPGSMTLKE